MTGKRREPGELESQILSVLWSAPAPLTTAEIAAQVDGALAYNTVQTVLARLLAKGAVIRESAGRAHAYSPVLDSAGLAARRMRAVLDREGDRAAVLNEFLDTLTPEDEDTLTRLLGLDRSRGGELPD